MGLTSQTEIERKYDVDAGTRVPDLSDVPGIAAVLPPDSVTMSAVYFDTEDLALARNRIALRRREGGADQGWHLKLPADLGRTEVHAQLTSDDQVPLDLRATVEVFLRGRPVTPLARVENQRTALELLDAEGRPVVELADDHVKGSDLRTGITRMWREWEAELVDRDDGTADTAILDEIEARLLAAGARQSASSSKLAHTLGADRLGDGAPDRRVSADRAGATRAIAVLLQSFQTLDPRVRRDDGESCHDMRTTARRLRSVLAATDHGDNDVESIRDELGRLGAVLGEARDLEVREEIAEQLFDTSGVTDLSRQRFMEDIHDEYRLAHNRIVEYLNSTAYFQTLDILDELVADREPDEQDLKRAVLNSVHAITKRTAAMIPAGSRRSVPRLVELHRLRRRIRRLRYLAEALISSRKSSFGADDDGGADGILGALAAAAHRVQDLLGQHRDLILFSDVAKLSAAQVKQDGRTATAYRAVAGVATEDASKVLDNLPGSLLTLDEKIAEYLEQTG